MIDEVVPVYRWLFICGLLLSANSPVAQPADEPICVLPVDEEARLLANASAPVAAKVADPSGARAVTINAVFTNEELLASTLIRVADAQSGDILWQQALPHDAAAQGLQVVSEVSVFAGLDGTLSRAYFGDLAGRVWRLSPPMPTSAEASDRQWRLHLFADLSEAAGVPLFPYSPDLVRATDIGNRPFDGVIVAGEVEDGQDTRIDLFYLRDYVPTDAQPVAPLSLDNLTDLRSCVQGHDDCAADETEASAGWWYRDLLPGDRLTGPPLVDGGRVFVSSWASSTLDCDRNRAESHAAIVDLQTGGMTAGLDGFLELGLQDLQPPRLRGNQLFLPGLAEELAEGDIDAQAVLNARGMQPWRIAWRDLLL